MRNIVSLRSHVPFGRAEAVDRPAASGTTSNELHRNTLQNAPKSPTNKREYTYYPSVAVDV